MPPGAVPPRNAADPIGARVSLRGDAGAPLEALTEGGGLKSGAAEGTCAVDESVGAGGIDCRSGTVGAVAFASEISRSSHARCSSMSARWRTSSGRRSLIAGTLREPGSPGKPCVVWSYALAAKHKAPFKTDRPSLLQCRAGPWSVPTWASTKVEPYPEEKPSSNWNNCRP